MWVQRIDVQDNELKFRSLLTKRGVQRDQSSNPKRLDFTVAGKSDRHITAPSVVVLEDLLNIHAPKIGNPISNLREIT